MRPKMNRAEPDQNKAELPEKAELAEKPALRGSPLLFALYFLAYLSVLIRMILNSPSDGVIGLPAYGLMALFLLFSLIQLPTGRRWPQLTQVHLAIQCVLVLLLLSTQPPADYYAMLGVALSIVAVRDLPAGWDLVWLAGLCVTQSFGLIAVFGFAGGTGYVPTYVAGCLIIGLYGRASRRAEEARARSEELLAELETANKRLLAFTEQAKAAAAANERAHLARELHDAATQTVFSINMTAEAARLCLQKDPSRVSALLDRIQELAGDALAELRTLVRELKPRPVAEIGLVRSLENHAAACEHRDGFRIAIKIEGEERGGIDMKEALFWIAREALNNTAKHAGIAEARLDLSFSAAEAVLRVSDAGGGFDAAGGGKADGDGKADGYGLIAMRERAEALGGTVVLRSAPGTGTEVEARIPYKQEAT